jgi:signal transduction histidine kinase
LHPVPAEPSGLELALEELAKNVNAVSKVKCRFDCPTPVPIPDQDVATNLFRIAQEAVQNALRHAEAGTIVIALDGGENEIRLSVSDDGCGLPVRRTGLGIGLEIMSYRAHAVGARFSVEPREPRGTTVTCTLPRSSFY